MLLRHILCQTNTVHDKGGAELAARKEVRVTVKLIDKEDAINQISHMMDIDGFRDGDCVSRRAVIGILDGMKEEPMEMIKKRIGETAGPEHYYMEKLLERFENDLK